MNSKRKKRKYTLSALLLLFVLLFAFLFWLIFRLFRTPSPVPEKTAETVPASQGVSSVLPVIKVTDGTPYGASCVCWMNGYGLCLRLKEGDSAVSAWVEEKADDRCEVFLQTKQGRYPVGTARCFRQESAVNRWLWNVDWEEERMGPEPVEPDLAGYCRLYTEADREGYYLIRSFDKKRRLVKAEPIVGEDTDEYPPRSSAGESPCEELALGSDAVFTVWDDWGRDMLLEEDGFWEFLEDEEGQEYGLMFRDTCFIRSDGAGNILSISAVFYP